MPPILATTSPAPLGPDRRTFVGPVELRAAPDGSSSPGTIVGYGALFNVLSCDLGGFYERIAPGAFTPCLTQDVRALVNHDANELIGRTAAGTMRLAEDELGLRDEIDLPATTCGRDVAENVRLGNISGQSFSFIVDVDEWDWSGATPVRTIRRFKQIYDVGPVTFPAYEQTSAAMRSYRAALAGRDLPEPPAYDPTALAALRQRIADAL
jgi:HK97 family phage prohead protease